MATNPFIQYGIKEVADVIVYDITTTLPVMYFDTLKVSSIEQTAEQTDARGGKGNPKLISWDYGKEITLTLQDALLSMKSLALLMNDADSAYNNDYYSVSKKIKKAEVVVLDAAKEFNLKYTPVATTGVFVLGYATAATTGTVKQFKQTFADASTVARVAYEVYTSTGGKGAYEIVITPEKFPGTYTFVGDTVIRNKISGVDEGFQFIIPKAKIGSEVTLTMEAEGDPTVFDMTITVLKADNGTMMSLVKYDIGTATSSVSSNLS